jgi:type IV pilus assembly protein PilM
VFGSDRIIALDIGASKIVVAEFLAAKGKPPQLLNYGIGDLGVSPESDSHSSALIVSTLREQLREHGIRPTTLLMTVSGQAVFPRYVKLPPVGKEKISQIVRYEAEQNVPFPIEEVVWDYQLIGSETGEANVMLVAVKVENVTRLTDCVQAAKLEPVVVDAAPMALCNAVYHNYTDLAGCTLVLDIGARSSNLIFVEGRRLFSRSVPVAGNTITSEIAKTFDISFDEAEQLKKQHAEVGLGGVYAGPEGEVADRISKIVRNIVTRLHAEVNRSVNFYRGQQGGSVPSLVLLTGGSSVIPNVNSFFADKLGADVEYLNPFSIVTVSPAISEERINNDMQLLGEVVGLALRHGNPSPVEINLMPPDLVAAKRFRRRQPYFAAAAAGLLVVMLCFWGYADRMQAMRRKQLRHVTVRIAGLKRVEKQLKAAVDERQAVAAKADRVMKVIGLRTQWLTVMDALHSCLLEGMWLRSIAPVSVQGGRIAQLEIAGKGFDDKLLAVDTPGLTAMEVFRNRLRANPHFGRKTEIKRLRPARAGDYAREFTLWVDLVTPIELL